MTRITSQFFATPAELVAWASTWKRKFGLVAVVMRFFPDYVAVKVSKTAELEPAAAEVGGLQRICLGVDEPDMTAESPYEFMVRNSEWLAIDVGEMTEEWIKESGLGANVEASETARVWRAIANDFKKRTSAGLWCGDPQTGKGSFYKNYRYSEKVAERARHGLKLLHIGGKYVFKVDRK